MWLGTVVHSGSGEGNRGEDPIIRHPGIGRALGRFEEGTVTAPVYRFDSNND